MKKLAFLRLGAAALALSACGSNEGDTLNAEQTQNMESEALNNLAAQAANAELEALGNQAQQLEEENVEVANEAAPVDNTVTSPSEVEDDVQGM